jgi:CheY-like chemotaxis protein
MKILLVDDDAMAADVDMIISDMNMPLLSGIDLFRQLREQGQNLPFVLLTGDAAGPLLAQEPRLDACLVKDFSLEETLAPAIAAVMQTRGGV